MLRTASALKRIGVRRAPQNAINDKMDEYAEEFYSNKKQKDDDLSL